MQSLIRPNYLLRAARPAPRTVAATQFCAANAVGPRFLTTESTTTTPEAPVATTTIVNPFARSPWPYHVNRTVSNNLPVYEKKSRTNPTTEQWTQIQKIDGGMDGLRRLKADLEEVLDLEKPDLAALAAASPKSGSSTRLRKPREKRNARAKKERENIKINSVTSHIIIPGHHREAVVSFLTQRGF